MLKGINNYFNNEVDYYANQHLIVHKDIFRRVIVKYWEMDNSNSKFFHPRS